MMKIPKKYKFNKMFRNARRVIDSPDNISAQAVLDILTSYLLGEDYYVVDSVSTSQSNVKILSDILNLHSKKWRKDLKAYNTAVEYVNIIKEVI